MTSDPSHVTITDPHRFAFVALGSNLGDSIGIIPRAIRDLRRMADDSFAASSLWRTDPVDCPPGSEPFINAVVGWRPSDGLTPETLLSELLALERDYGRRQGGLRNAPRPLDLDLIAFPDERRDTPDLTLPHPRAHLRLFVLEPLAELAPDWKLPGQTATVTALIDAFPSNPTESARRVTG